MFTTFERRDREFYSELGFDDLSFILVDSASESRDDLFFLSPRLLVLFLEDLSRVDFELEDLGSGLLEVLAEGPGEGESEEVDGSEEDLFLVFLDSSLDFDFDLDFDLGLAPLSLVDLGFLGFGSDRLSLVVSIISANLFVLS